MLECCEMPMLPSEASRPKTVISGSGLKDVGVSSNAFGIHPGEIIYFENAEPLVVSQPISDKLDSPVVYYVAVRKFKCRGDEYGRPAWLCVSFLTKRDAYGVYLDKLRESLARFPDFVEAYKFLVGKKIIGVEYKVFDMPIFRDGKLTSERCQRCSTTIELLNDEFLDKA